MHILFYGNADQNYDLPASCRNCRLRHIARIPKGTAYPAQAACPHCGVGGSLIFGSSSVAETWLKENSRPTCLNCGIPIAGEEYYCNTCWRSSFLSALKNVIPHPLEGKLPPFTPESPS